MVGTVLEELAAMGNQYLVNYFNTYGNYPSTSAFHSTAVP
jgi:hypothetical protein